MSKIELGPLPEPKWRCEPNSEGTQRCTCDSYPHAGDCGMVFGPDQMRAYAEAEVAKERERNAKLCESLATFVPQIAMQSAKQMHMAQYASIGNQVTQQQHFYALKCAEAIRKG